MAWQVLKQRSLPTGLVCAVPVVETVGAGGRWIPLEANNLWTAKNRLQSRFFNAGENGGSGGARTRNLCRDRAAL